MVESGRVVADVGCDHAYVSIYLIEEGLAEKCLAIDVKEGPLAIAEENIAKRSLTDKIETRLGSGLRKVSPNEADTVLMAGMGGMLIVKLITDDIITALSASEWVFEPQSDVALVRKLIRKCGYVIDKEEMVMEEGKYYPIIHAVRGPKVIEATGEEYGKKLYELVTASEKKTGVSEFEHEAVYDRYGKYLIENKNEVLMKYLDAGEEHYSRILENIVDDTGRAAQEMKNELSLVRQAQELMK